MQMLSEPQASLLEKLKGGATLVHEAQTTGRFRLTESGGVCRTIHPATVESLIASGVLFKDLMGRVQTA